VYKYSSGEKYIGEFKNGDFDGDGIIIKKNGKQRKVTFKDGSLINTNPIKKETILYLVIGILCITNLILIKINFSKRRM